MLGIFFSHTGMGEKGDARDLLQGVLHAVHVPGQGGEHRKNLSDLLLGLNFRPQGASLAYFHPDRRV